MSAAAEGASAHGVFLGSASDLSANQLRGRTYQRLGRDLYVVRERRAADAVLGTVQRVEAARLVFPEAVVCLWTAAQLLHLPLPVSADTDAVHLDRGQGAARSERPGIKVHRLAIPSWQLHDLQGVPVGDGPRTMADLSSRMGLEALVALGDVVLRRWVQEAVGAAACAHGCRRGAVLLRQALALLDAGADSPAESRARLRLHAAGFVALGHQVTVTDSAGGWLARPDLADAEARVAVQHDGDVHFRGSARQRRQDLDRDELLRLEGWQVVVSTARDDGDRDLLIRKVTAAYLRAAQLHGAHVLPPHLR